MMYQEAVDKCLQTIGKQSKPKKPGQMALFGTRYKRGRIRQSTEYRIYYTDDDVDHVSRADFNRLLANPTADKRAIAKVIRHWQDDDQLISENEQYLYEVE